jgi:hypothetical protein
MPEWLKNSTEHADRCRIEIGKYKKIEELLGELSSMRERTKAAHLVHLLHNHRLVIAFDRKLITLHALRHEIASLGHTQTALGTGSSGRQEVADLLGLESKSSGTIALCSDAMAEGMNLQSASAVVHLDLPSVIRVVEQRIGRVDRMDSPYERIEVWWPDDSDEFALRSDDLLVERHFDVHTLLGSNMRLPKRLGAGGSAELIRATHILHELGQEARRRERQWQGMPDALESVRQLVSGKNALIEQKLYESMRNSKARIESAVSVVNVSDGGWVFLAIEGAGRGAPRWVFLPSLNSHPVTELEQVSAALRAKLSGEPENRRFDKRAAEQLHSAVQRISEEEVLLLPRKRQRALKEMQHVLTKYRTAALRSADSRRVEVIEEILAASDSRKTESTNLGMIAEWWLELARPMWTRHLSKRRHRPAMLREIRREMVAEPLETEALESFSHLDLASRPLDQRVIAAIIGLMADKT